MKSNKHRGDSQYYRYPIIDNPLNKEEFKSTG